MRSSALRVVVLLVAPLLVTGLVTGLLAWIPLGPIWPDASAPYWINPNFPDTPGNPGTPDQQIEALSCGLNAWHNQGQGDFEFDYQGTTTVDFVDTNDNVNVVFWSPMNTGALATTFFVEDPQGNFLEFDIAYWAEDFNGEIAWVGVGDPDPDEFDMIYVSSHEFGHALGLGHTTFDDATMFAIYNGIESRVLHPDDVAGVIGLYGIDPTVVNTPVLNDVDPPFGPPDGGNPVTLTGVNFTWHADTTLLIDGVVLPSDQYLVQNCATIVIDPMPPGNLGAVSIEIQNELGNVLLDDAYLYGTPGVTIFGIDPDIGPVDGGTAVTIDGAEFSVDTEVSIGTEPLQNLQFISPTEIQGTIPPGPGSGFVDVTITDGMDMDVLVDGYRYTTDTLRVVDSAGSAGSLAFVEVRGTHEEALEGYSFGVVFDGAFLEILDVTNLGTVAEDADFFFVQLSNDPADSHWTVDVDIDFGGGGSIPPGMDEILALATYEIDGSAPVGMAIDLTLAEGLGDIPVPIVYRTPTAEFTPILENGALTVSDSVFIRGDANYDGSLTGLVDGLYTLNYFFASGPPPPCPDAMDADDSGSLQGIVDGLYILNYQFAGGFPPPAPFPTAGGDPTPDGLGCL